MTTATATPAMTRGVRLGRLAGVEVIADWSLLVVSLLVAVGLGNQTLPRLHPEWSGSARWTVAAVSAASYIGSLLVAELAHVGGARTRGVSIDRVTLLVFCAVTDARREPRSGDELAIVSIGPMTNLILGVGFVLVATALGAGTFENDGVAEGIRALDPASTVVLWLGLVNIVLGLACLIPGFLPNAGRLLSAMLWWVIGDTALATRWATVAGQVVAIGVMGVGVLVALGGGVLLGSGLVLIGWFLDNAANDNAPRETSRAALVSVPVSRIMRRRFDHVTPGTTLASLLTDHVLRGEQRAFPVLVAGEWVGLISLGDVRRVGSDRWPERWVADVMTPREALVTIGPDDSAFDALGRLGRHGVAQLPVVDARGALVGLVLREDIISWLAVRPELRGARSE